MKLTDIDRDGAVSRLSADGLTGSGMAPSRVMWFSLICVGLMLVLPLVQPRHTNPITSFYSEWVAFVIGAAALLPLVLRRYTAPLQVPRTALIPVAMVSVLVVHIVLVKSPYPQQPLLAMIYLLWSAALVLLAAALRREFGVDRLVAVLAGFVLAGGLLNTIAGVLQHYEWRGPFESIVATKLYFQVYGNLGQPNHFATHIVLALVSLGYFYATARMALKRTVVLALPLLFVLALSGSRSSWFYLVGIVGFALFTHRVARTAETGRTLHFAVALIPGLIAAHLISQLPFLAPPTPQETTIDRIFSLASTSSDRLQLWREAWAMFVGAPVFGVGWGQFAWHNFLLTGELEGSPLKGLYNHAHNLLLQLLAETGAIGAGIVVIGIVVWARYAWPLLSQVSGWWIWACLIVLGLHSMLEYPLWNAYFLGIACVLLGSSDTRTLQLHHARLVRLGVIVLIAGTAWIGTMMLDRYHRLESVIYARYGDKNGLTLEQAHREMLAVRESFFLLPYVDLAYARDMALNVTDIDRKLAFTARVMHFAPTGMVAYRHAALNALAGNELEARAILSRAVVAYPMLLDTFVREFAAADTGNREAQARFLTELQHHATKRGSDDRSSSGDENRHILPNFGGVKRDISTGQRETGVDQGATSAKNRV